MENENAAQNSNDQGTLVQLPRMVNGEQTLVAFFEKDGVLTPFDEAGKPPATAPIAVVKVESEATAGMSPYELRKHISAKMGAPVEPTAKPDEGAKSAADVREARLKLASTYKYRMLMPESGTETNDGLYVFLCEMIFGLYARASNSTNPGYTHKMLALPFIPAGELASLRKALAELLDRTWNDLEPVLTSLEARGVKIVFSLIRDGIQDFGSILPNTKAASLIYKELANRKGVVANPMSKGWPFNVLTLYKEILTEITSDIDKDLTLDIHEIASGYATYLTQLTRSISEVGFLGADKHTYEYDPTRFFKSVNNLKAASTESRAKSDSTTTTESQAKNIGQLAETHKQQLLDILLNDAWLSIPFEKAEFGTLELSKMVRTFLGMQAGVTRLPSAHEGDDILARTRYQKRLTDLNDRVSRLIHRYGGALADFNATHKEREDIFAVILDALRSGNSVATNDPEKQAGVGKKIRSACNAIKEVIEGIADANVAPANLRSFKSQSVMAVMSYYVDFWKTVRTFLVSKDDIPDLTETEALGYISWMKGLASRTSIPSGKSSLFVHHTGDEEFGDDAIVVPGGLSLEDDDESSVDDEGDLEDQEWLDLAIEEKYRDPAFRLYLWDWISSFDDEGQAYRYYSEGGIANQYEMRIENLSKTFNCSYDLALEAFARSRFTKEPELQTFYTENIEKFDTVLEAVECYDDMNRSGASSAITKAIRDALEAKKDEVPKSEKAKEEEADVISITSHGASLNANQVALILKHHAGAPMYYQVGWSAYWEEYEGNLKKNYGKKDARKTRRTEEDVVGCSQYKKLYHRDPPNMFFRSYTKKGTTYTPAVVAPPVEPKPEEYKHYYFAYGSNLDEAQVQKRTPFAKFVCRVALKDYKLTFVTYSYSWKGGIANVEPSEGDVVYGVLWHFTDEMLTKMDRYEGYPNKYTRKEVQVTKLIDDASDMPQEITAIVYEIKSEIDKKDFQPAGDTYYNQIKAAYEKFALPMIVLEESQKYSTDNKAPYKSWSGVSTAGSTYYDYNGFESDDDYYDRWKAFNKQQYKDFDFETKTHTVTASSKVDPSSLFHPDRWYLDMNAEWWAPANV